MRLITGLKIGMPIFKATIYDENKELKSKTLEDQIFVNLDEETGINYYYEWGTITIYMDFSFSDSYYETYINFHYKYNLDKNIWEEYEEEYCEYCGEE